MESDHEYLDSQCPSPSSITILENCTINSLNAEFTQLPVRQHRRQRSEPTFSEPTSRNLKLSRPALETQHVPVSSYGERRYPVASTLDRQLVPVWRNRQQTERINSGRLLAITSRSEQETGYNLRSLDEPSSIPADEIEGTSEEEETIVLKRRRNNEKFELTSHTTGDAKRITGAKEKPEILKLTEEIKPDVLKLREEVTVDLTQRICEGSKIFKGKHHGRCGEDVAVKIIKRYTKENMEEIENLKSAADHKNVVNYYFSGFCEYRGKKSIYIVMELCDVQTLEKRIDGRFMERGFPEKLAELCQIAKGLKHLHKRCRILHRDLKPPNILYKDGICKISDFGLSKRMLPGKSNTRQSMAEIGTNGWRAPETADCEANSSTKSDIYSLALIFYYDLTDGIHPFGPDERKHQHNIRTNSGMSLEKCQNMPDGRIIENLLLRMLSFEPEDRPNIEDVLKHPAFWNTKKKQDFYDAILKYEKYRVEQNKQNRRAMRSDSKRPRFNPCCLADELDKRSETLGRKVLPNNWITTLTLSRSERKKFQRDGIKPKEDCIKEKATGKQGKSQFDGKSVFLCVKFIRNRDEHHLEDRAGGDFIMDEEQLWEFYSNRYPYLFIYAYTVVKECLNAKSADKCLKETFKSYF